MCGRPGHMALDAGLVSAWFYFHWLGVGGTLVPKAKESEPHKHIAAPGPWDSCCAGSRLPSGTVPAVGHEPHLQAVSVQARPRLFRGKLPRLLPKVPCETWVALPTGQGQGPH